MNPIFEKYKAFTEFLLKLLNNILQKPDSLTQLIGKLILFVIFFIIALIALAFTGLFEDPSVLFNVR